jgi:hypothetical protein
MTTQTVGRNYPLHNHGAWLAKGGNGNTDLEAGHFHRVVGFQVLANESDGHTHDLTMLPCGAGAPFTVGRREVVSPSYFGAGPEVATRALTTEEYRAIETARNYAAQKKLVMWALGLGAVAAVGVVVIGAVMVFGDRS